MNVAYLVGGIVVNCPLKGIGSLSEKTAITFVVTTLRLGEFQDRNFLFVRCLGLSISVQNN